MAMKLLVRAVVTGFGLSLGAAIFKKVQRQLGFDDDSTGKKDNATDVTTRDGATDPGLRHDFS
jgi:hypothetical protein